MTGLFDKIFKRTHDQPETVSSNLPAEGEQFLQADLELGEKYEPSSFDQNRALRWDFGCAQSVGQVREHNEDSIFAFSTIIPVADELVPIGLFIVADGMGGHLSGEIASNLAVSTFASHTIQEIIQPLLGVEPRIDQKKIADLLSDGFMAANQTIISNAPGSGTTMTAALIFGDQIYIGHVGDSRAYAISPEGDASILTRDHSLVKRMIELGQLSEEAAANHPQRNVLYRALGQADPFTPDVIQIGLPTNGDILLCTDGLWGVISQSEMIEIIREDKSPGISCQKLVEAANLAGGPDNISVLLIHLA